MKDKFLRLWQIVIAFSMLMIYVVYKYGTHWVAFPVLSHTYGIVWGGTFLAVITLIASCVQLIAYRKAQKILRTTVWLQAVKSGDFGSNWYTSKWWFKFRLMWIFNQHGYAVLIGVATQMDPFLATVAVVDTRSLAWRTPIVFFWACIIGEGYSIIIYLVLHGLLFG